MVPMLITDCGILVTEADRFRNRDFVTLCRGKLWRGPIREVIDDGRSVLIRYSWIAEKGPAGEWFEAPSAVATDVLKSELAMSRGGVLYLFINGYKFAAIMPEGDNLGPGQVKNLKKLPSEEVAVT